MPSAKLRDHAAAATEVLSVKQFGQELLRNPLLNKGSAFIERERDAFRLHGLLPSHIFTLDEQTSQSYLQFQDKKDDLEKNIFLTQLHDTNETLFFRLVTNHAEEMVPIIYTPVEAAAIESFSHGFRRPRGLFLSYPDKARIKDIIADYPEDEVEAIVVTDSEAILGIGDQGVGGIGITVGKLAIYTVCAGIYPGKTLPIVLDVGTNNQKMLNDPLYMGWRHERLRGTEYDAFVDTFIQAVKKKWPKVCLQWEDFGRANARRLIDKYRNQLLTFNDDIQGTGAVALAAIIAAVAVRYKDRMITIGECNNCLIFPGLALGAIAAEARHVSNAMIHAASYALSECAPALTHPDDGLVPRISEAREVSRKVAFAVGTTAQKEGLARKTSAEELQQNIADKMWTPAYSEYKKD